jgi:hypothetical protein
VIFGTLVFWWYFVNYGLFGAVSTFKPEGDPVIFPWMRRVMVSVIEYDIVSKHSWKFNISIMEITLAAGHKVFTKNSNSLKKAEYYSVLFHEVVDITITRCHHRANICNVDSM